VRDLSKVHAAGRGGRPVAVLEGCGFVAEPGELTVLVGPSGSGKTTLVNLIAGYDEPTTGEVLVDGRPVRGPSPERLVMFQETALWPWMTVLDNVTFGPRTRGVLDRAAAEREGLAVLDHLGLTGFAHRYPGHLSGGMQRRAELARALVNRPRLLLLDEPFRGLDALTRELMHEYFLRVFAETGTTTLFITSEIEEAVFLADHLVVLSSAPGRVISSTRVDLPHPRTADTLYNRRYLQLVEQTLALIA
jgi:NitT/TauT family transport system ATP-binding protein